MSYFFGLFLILARKLAELGKPPPLTIINDHSLEVALRISIYATSDKPRAGVSE